MTPLAAALHVVELCMQAEQARHAYLHITTEANLDRVSDTQKQLTAARLARDIAFGWRKV